MKMSELARKQGVYNKLVDRLIQDEFYNTMDEGWTTEGSFEAEVFLSMSDSEKKLYALSHANQFSIFAMDEDVSEFYRIFGDYYDDIITLPFS